MRSKAEDASALALCIKRFWGQGDGKGAYRQPESLLWNPCDGRREPTPAMYPLAFTHTPFNT